MQELVQPMKYKNVDCYVTGKENYDNFLEKIQKIPNQQEVMSQNVRGPITVNRVCYIISKVAYEYFFRKRRI